MQTVDKTLERTFISEVKDSQDETILLRGWVYKIIDLSNIVFVKLRDKSGIIQLVTNKEQIEGLKLENAIEVIGKKSKNEKAPGGIEIIVDEIKILGRTYYDKLPFEINSYKNKAALETQLDHRTIALRRPEIRAIFKVQNEIEQAFRDYLRSKNFEQIHTAKIIDSSTEGGSEMFTVNYFDRRSFLAQSPQFYKQMMVGAGFERVYEIGHAYRAELHNTWRHLNEYVSLDVEMGFIKDEFELMDLEEGFLDYLFKHLNKVCKKELEMYKVELPNEVKIPRITLEESHKILLEKYNKKSPIGNIDAKGEELICDYVKKEYGTEFVFLTKYPVAKRPMYTMPDDEDKTLTKSFDLIYDGLEITTGGQRINDYEMLKENIIKFGLNPEDFDFYLDTFKYGMPPHGGFAIGLERLTMKILKLSNIREATLVPRDMKRLTP
ncbi:aspartate--tRNA(Asn) ligase [Intestinibacter bartlettii]|uniref:aspartate--tRNA(Asn) ligase n=1 Tax=Intestinibacter bartlettii TaxID=261299 RepID=UPI00066490F4|nr:aspartate--tRNA(Asn) ligase [Intestinibacter bartlettii]KMW25027.1 aspartyl-tRNA synthetase [Clostridium sp. 1_1_41A1FAA]MDU1254856.1 aspartate--tRNA(Asn) ligase [Peptostreptococcaceae bacterium]MDU5920446.1 aspartate--tRNA(Asn) ligase [Clostridiales bacterium]MCB5744730.1 aspartate--tRNA(Asn) ligase [Intestinibacter bartlettii]MDU2694104.1 aspartate--tRNA(Asn) ligase [Intestinibacter bartlettii]